MSAVSLGSDIAADATSAPRSCVFHEMTPARLGEWLAAGHRRRHFFAHRVVHLPKCGPDGFLLAERMGAGEDPEAMWEVVLYADRELLAEFPPDLFFDDEIVWHQQQFGRAGQIATANLVLDGSTLHCVNLLSDLVQRIGRRREHKTRVETVFRGWRHVLLNAVLAFADARGARRVRIPGSQLAGRHTDPKRDVDLALFERIYDRTVNDMAPARRDGEWWEVDLARARERIVPLRPGAEPLPARRTICVCHDTERGLGHLDWDVEFARRADRGAPRDLEAMLEVEAGLGVRTTYCVVGCLLDDVRAGIAAGGHSLAFHSFDHRLDREDQLERCRRVDYRLKGYRPPRSRLTSELTDRNLLRRNFEWVATSERSLGGRSQPAMRAGLVWLPVALDDHPMFVNGTPYDEWERGVLARAAGAGDVLVLGLHDCYAGTWLAGYRDLLERLIELGELRTLDEVAADVTLTHAA